ncbi:MAG: hypothetical protein OER97_09180 [Gammaproteobacteria bacterium]|nr:hypothetical protein [Gammaproteobacteria bacterium]
MFALLMTAGCATPPPQPEPAEPPPVEVVVEPTIPIIEPTPPPPIVEAPPVTVTPLPAIAIVLSSRNPDYEDVVFELENHLENYSIYDLSDKSQPPAAAFRLINDSDTVAVVAIGLIAATSAVQMANVPVIFSQVFNYQDHGLITESSRGVAAIVPVAAQIAAWKDIDPNVSEIGIIIGEGHEDLVAEAELAAEQHAISLKIRTAHSDQETLYLYKRMIQDIDGFWLFPDNRILSTRILNEILQSARHRNVAVLVSNESMLAMGATISISSVPSDIAEKITEIIRLIQANRFADVPSLTPLSDIRVETNEAFLQKPVVAAEPEISEGTPQ